jgi:methylmalonyl-CoA mutase
VRTYHRETESQADAMRRVWHLEETARTLSGEGLEGDRADLLNRLKAEIDRPANLWTPETEKLVREWEDTRNAIPG